MKVHANRQRERQTLVDQAQKQAVSRSLEGKAGITKPRPRPSIVTCDKVKDLQALQAKAAAVWSRL